MKWGTSPRLCGRTGFLLPVPASDRADGLACAGVSALACRAFQAVRHIHPRVVLRRRLVELRLLVPCLHSCLLRGPANWQTRRGGACSLDLGRVPQRNRNAIRMDLGYVTLRFTGCGLVVGHSADRRLDKLSRSEPLRSSLGSLAADQSGSRIATAILVGLDFLSPRGQQDPPRITPTPRSRRHDSSLYPLDPAQLCSVSPFHSLAL